jgi:glycosyltransferase involved in cell wall biosynthesis
VDVVIDPRLPAQVARQCRTLTCLRPLFTLELQRTLGRLQAEGVTLIGEYDDLLFAGEVSGLPESVGGGLVGADRRARFAAYAEGLNVFDAFTVSTRALAVELQRRAPQARVTVVPNGLSETWLTQGRALYRRFQPGDPKVIRYFAGSPSHDRDFAGIIEPLARFLDQHRDVRLEVVGPLKFDGSRFPNGSVAALRSVSYDILPGLLASTWVNLAPLEPTAYNDCKSALKVLESGAFECPTLASPCDDVLRHVELGAPTVVCRSPDDWYSGLDTMLDLRWRAEHGQAIAEHVRVHGMARSALPGWLSGLGLEGVT